MASDTFNIINEAHDVVGLGTWTHTAIATALYNVQVQSTLALPGSTLNIAIKLNGSSIVNATINSGDSRLNLQTVLSCIPTDIITVVLSSTAITDQHPNHIKTNIQIRKGFGS
jgi:hypothetical protein